MFVFSCLYIVCYMNRLSSRKQTILESILIRPKETLSTNNLTTRLTFVLWCSVQVYSCSLQRDYIFRNGKCYLSRSFVIDSILCTSATRCASTLNIHCNLHHFKHIHKLVRWFIEISETNKEPRRLDSKPNFQFSFLRNKKENISEI